MRETAVRSLTKAARKVEPRVYATESHKEPNFLPTGMEECTFKPKTNVGGGAAAALGRGRGHSGSEVTDELQTTTGSTGTGSGGRAAEVGGHPLTALGSDLGDAGEWDDFISRQQEFLERKQRKLDEAVGALRAGGAPAMSPGTKRILARAGLKHKALEAAAEADGLAAADGTAGNGSAGRPHSALDGGGSRLQQPTASSATKGRRPTTAAAGARGSKDAAAYVDPECTFKPAITKLAQRMPSRSFAEMSEQARAREEWLEEQRIMRELESMADATFRPQLVAQRSYAGPAASKLELRDPQKYMAMVQARQRAKQEVLNKAALEREARQLEECTFKPSINKLPAYLERRYHHQSTQADDGRGSELGYAGRALRSASTTQDDLPDYR